MKPLWHCLFVKKFRNIIFILNIFSHIAFYSLNGSHATVETDTKAVVFLGSHATVVPT